MAQINNDVRTQLEQLRLSLEPDDERVTVIDSLLQGERPQAVAWPATYSLDAEDGAGVATWLQPALTHRTGPSQVKLGDAAVPMQTRLETLHGFGKGRGLGTRPARIALWVAGIAASMMLVNIMAGSQATSPAHIPPIIPTRSTDMAAGAHSHSATGSDESAYLLRGAPDPALTPGDYELRSNMRLPSAVVRGTAARQALSAYGVDPAETRYTVCRLIPPTLGGTDSARNLFPVTLWYAEVKSRLDRELTRLVNAKKLTSSQARAELTAGWLQAAHRRHVRNYGRHNTQHALNMDRAMRG